MNIGLKPISHLVFILRLTFITRLSFSGLACKPRIISKNLLFRMLVNVCLWVRISSSLPRFIRYTIDLKSLAFLLRRSGPQVSIPSKISFLTSCISTLNTGRCPEYLAEWLSASISTKLMPKCFATAVISLICESIDNA